jgi:hypothetical protein
LFLNYDLTLRRYFSEVSTFYPKSVAIFLILFVSVISAFAGIDVLFGESVRNWIVILLAILYIYVSLFTAASCALFMDITDPRIGATLLSAFMGQRTVVSLGLRLRLGD